MHKVNSPNSEWSDKIWGLSSGYTACLYISSDVYLRIACAELFWEWNRTSFASLCIKHSRKWHSVSHWYTAINFSSFACLFWCGKQRHIQNKHGKERKLLKKGLTVFLGGGFIWDFWPCIDFNQFDFKWILNLTNLWKERLKRKKPKKASVKFLCDIGFKPYSPQCKVSFFLCGSSSYSISLVWKDQDLYGMFKAW